MISSNPTPVEGAPASASPSPLWKKPPLWAALALVLAAAALAIVHQIPKAGFWLFVFSGVCLAVSAVVSEKGGTLGRWNTEAAPRRSWEIPFFVLLVVLTAAPRMALLDDCPAGTRKHEGEMVSEMMQMEKTSDLVIHVQNSDINWPSLVFYQAIGLTKLMGMRPAAYRMESALWGILAVLAFFFVARSLFSPEAAAGASLLFSGSFYHLTQSRNIFPGTILNFAVLAGLGLLLLSLKRRSTTLAALAGVAAGLGMWGYIPGRGIPFLFAGWLVFVAVFHKKFALTKGQWIAFLGFMVLVSLPVIYYALRWPQYYWTYVASANPNGNKGVFSYLQTILNESHHYIECFHLRGDDDAGLSIPGRPMLDTVTGYIFPLGFFAALALFWRPGSAFMLALFVAGLLPAILGGNFSHPTTRRIILAWPAVFLFVGLVLEQLRRSFNASLSRSRDAWFAIAFVALGLVSYYANVRMYFVDFVHDPQVISRIFNTDYRIYKDHTAEEKSLLVASPIFDCEAWSFYFPEVPNTKIYEPEDLLRLDTPQEVDAYIDPLYRGAAELVQAAVPTAQVQEVPAPFWPDVTVSNDPVVPKLLYVRVRIPAGGLTKARGLELAGAKDDAFDAGFGARFKGREVELRGSIVLPRDPKPVSLGVEWPGFRVELDGRPVPQGKPLDAAGGIHDISVSGRVPGDATGSLPLHLQGAPLIVYPFRWPYGTLATFYEGSKAWNGPARFSRRLAASAYRFHDIGEVFLPYSIRLTAGLTAPETGVYTFVSNQWSQVRLNVGGKTVFDSIPGETMTAKAVRLQAGRTVPLEAFHEGFNGGPGNRTFLLEWSKDGGASAPVPVTAFKTPEWTSWRPAKLPAAVPVSGR
jgi:hypothetical protein